MTAQDGGRFCSDCKKVVADLSKNSIDKLGDTVSVDSGKEVCGSFFAYQLDRPFNNWKDKLISFYQKTIRDKTVNRLIKPAILFSIMTLLLLTGCVRRLQGRYSTKSIKKCKHNHQTTQTTACLVLK